MHFYLKEDRMNNHPPKSTLADIMSKDLITLSEETSVTTAAAKMAAMNIGAIVIIGRQGDVLGIVSERDLAYKIVAQGKNPAEVSLSEIMTKNPKCLSTETSILDAFNLTQTHQFRHIPITDNGKLVGIVSVRDINKAIYEEREFINELKTKFVAITSHELRTPYAIIRGYIDMMRSDLLGPFTEAQEKAIHRILEAMKRVEKILCDLEKFYLGSSPFSEKKFEPTHPHEAIEETTRDIHVFLEKRKLRLNIEMQENLPHILAFKNEIKQVLFNLCMNAIRFTPDGGTITVRAKHQANEVSIEVEDTGIGIPKDKLTAIFESFYEVRDVLQHSSGHIEFQSSGMGLGLAIAKKIIDSYGGKIWAESEEGQYSRFIFTLPKK